MRTIILALLTSFILTTWFACVKGVWTSETSYRAKRQRYSLAKEPFRKSALIDSKFMYKDLDTLTSNEGEKSFSAIGFLEDGRAIFNGYRLSKFKIENAEQNSWQSANEVGYYRVTDDRIVFEFLTSKDFGQYIIWKGVISGDSVKFSVKDISKTKHYTFVKSALPISIK